MDSSALNDALFALSMDEEALNGMNNRSEGALSSLAASIQDDEDQAGIEESGCLLASINASPVLSQEEEDQLESGSGNKSEEEVPVDPLAPKESREETTSEDDGSSARIEPQDIDNPEPTGAWRSRYETLGISNCSNCWTAFCHWDKDSKDVGVIMLPLALSLLLVFTLAMVLGGAFENKDPTLDNFFRLIIGDVRINGYLLYPEVWDAIEQDPYSTQAQAYQFLRKDDTTKQLMEDILERDYVTRDDADRIQQRFALASLYYATGGNKWFWDTNWLNGSMHECQWFSTSTEGDVCEPVDESNGTLTTYHTLSLKENNLRGTMPPYLLDFLSLLNLDLSSNHLTNTLDDMVGPRGFPRGVIDLNLRNNSLSGDMERFIKYFDRVESLWLQHNSITGRIPNDIWTRSHLQQLGLSFNQLTGPIPPELGMLTGTSSLLERSWSSRKRGYKGVYLDNNQLTASIPTELAALGTHLGHLWLHNNQLTGSLPVDLDRCYVLKTLTLANNKFNSSIPTELLSFTELLELDLSNNQLTGSLGSELGTMRDLHVLRIANNSIHGSIPYEISSLTDLQFLDLSGNANMTGVIPESLCAISSLKVDCTNLCGCHCNSCFNNSNTIPSALMVDFPNSTNTSAPTSSPTLAPTASGATPSTSVASFPSNTSTLEPTSSVTLTPTDPSLADNIMAQTSTNATGIERNNDT